LIHIQGRHTNLSGQENLAKTLDEISQKYFGQSGASPLLVLSEGGAGDCSLTAAKKIAGRTALERVAKSYLIQGKISGEEYLYLVSDLPMKILGSRT